MTHSCIKTISRFGALNIPWTCPTSMSRRFEQHHGIHLCRLGCWVLAGRNWRFKNVWGVGWIGWPSPTSTLQWVFFARCFTDVFVWCLLKFWCFRVWSPPLDWQLWFPYLYPLARAPFIRSTKDYVLVYAQSTLAEQSTPAYIAIIDSDMPVTNIIWVGEDWLLGVGARCMSHVHQIFPWNTRGVSPVLTRKARIWAFAWQVQYNGMLEILPRCSPKRR